MMVFWWQGRGFITLLILAGSMILVGMVADAIKAPSYTPYFWAAALVLAALVNWPVGRRLNYLRRSSLMPLSPLK